MDWFASVDLYCERVGTGLWVEPLNAWTNLAFPVAAALAWREARAVGQARPVVALLCVMAALVGVGSWLFHVFANHWSEWADVVPIWSFVAVFVVVAVGLLGGVRPGWSAWIGAGVAAVLVIVLTATTGDDGSGTQADPLNGSGQYAPALAALVVLSVVTGRRGHPIRGWIWAGTLVFMAALTFRTVDLMVCPWWPNGTHFLWHLLNGTLVGLLLFGLIRTAPARRLL